MIELNLIPEEFKKKKKKFEIPEIQIAPVAAVFAGILVVVQLFLGGIVLIGKAQLAALDKTWQGLEPKRQVLDDLKKSITFTDKKIKSLEVLMEARVSWAELLNALSDSLTANIWLTELSSIRHEGKSRNLKLSGSALARGEGATRDIARFIKALKANKNFFRNFEDIELVSIKEGSQAGQNVMNFTLACKFKPKGKGA